MGGPIGLIIFDTFAKLVAAAGGDENKAKDQGRVFANLQRVKDKLTAALGAPHIALDRPYREGRDPRRARLKRLLGDVDLMVDITPAATFEPPASPRPTTLPEGPLFSFKSEVHEFGTDEDGDPITVNIVSSEDVSATTAQASRATPDGKSACHVPPVARRWPRWLTTEDWNEQSQRRRHREETAPLRDQDGSEG